MLPWGSVAVAVTTGSPAGGVNGTSKTTWPWLVGRHLQRSQVVLGLPRALGRIAGAGIDVDAEGRVGRAAAQPALEPAIGRGDDDGEVLEVVRSLARCTGVVGDPIAARGRWPRRCR